MGRILIYYRDDYVKNDGTSSIFLQLFIGKKRVLVKTGISVEKDFFDYQERTIRKGHPKSRDYNLLLNQAKARANDILIRYRLMEKQLSPENFKREFYNPSNYIDFYAWMNQEIELAKGLLTPSTISQRFSILNKLKEYSKKATFADINLDYIEGFEKYLKTRRKNNINTAYKNLRTLSIYLNIAVRKDLIPINPFRQIRLRKGPPNIVYLDRNELRILKQKYNDGVLRFNLQKTLLYFLFSCVTGLRYSDIKIITGEMIINNILIFEPQKTKNTTGKTIKVPLTDFARKLIQDAGRFRVSGNIFDTYSDQKTNVYLKDIAILCGIKKNITFHIARHTFATLFLEETDDLATLQQLLGHSSIMQTMVYAHVSEMKKKIQIKKFEKVLI